MPNSSEMYASQIVPPKPKTASIVHLASPVKLIHHQVWASLLFSSSLLCAQAFAPRYSRCVRIANSGGEFFSSGRFSNALILQFKEKLGMNGT